MAELRNSKLPRRLVILVALIGCLGFFTSAEPAHAVEYTGCGDPWVMETESCTWYVFFCKTERYACVNCDQGSPCYRMD